MTDPWPRTPCSSACKIPPDLHVHYEREPGDYFKLAAPMLCCGREFLREDEFLLGDQCQWCFADKKPMPGAHLLVYRTTSARQRRKGRR